MVNDLNLMGFGGVLMLSSVMLILSWVGSKPKGTQTQKALADDPKTQVNFPSAEPADRQIAQLQQQCLRLRQVLQHQQQQTIEAVRNSTFEQLQTLLTSYPTAQQMVQAKPDLPAGNLLALLTPLENLLEDWGIEPIGSAWEQVLYDPQLHQPDTDQIAEGEPVYIRFVGYRRGDRIFCLAQVSRTLPIGISTML